MDLRTKLWPDNIEINASEKSEAEKRVTRRILKAAIQTTELIQHQLLKRHNLKRARRTLAWLEDSLITATSKKGLNERKDRCQPLELSLK